jgi:excisionase family DNA binding protein
MDAAMVGVAEAARLVDRSPSTIRRWIRDGSLPATRWGWRYLIDLVELEKRARAEWIADLPPAWRTTFWGAPMPNVVLAIRRSREDH